MEARGGKRDARGEAGRTKERVSRAPALSPTRTAARGRPPAAPASRFPLPRRSVGENVERAIEQSREWTGSGPPDPLGGFEMAAPERICPACGAEATPEACTCPRCGAEMAEAARYLRRRQRCHLLRRGECPRPWPPRSRRRCLVAKPPGPRLHPRRLSLTFSQRLLPRERLQRRQRALRSGCALRKRPRRRPGPPRLCAGRGPPRARSIRWRVAPGPRRVQFPLCC